MLLPPLLAKFLLFSLTSLELLFGSLLITIIIEGYDYSDLSLGRTGMIFLIGDEGCPSCLACFFVLITSIIALF